MNKINLFVKLLILPLVMLACGSDDNANPMNSGGENNVIDDPQNNTLAEDQIETIIVKDLPADPERSGAFTYFSLRKNTRVDGPDNNDWDIAFNSITVLTNSGVSGSGQGGGMVLTGENFDKLKELPTIGWQVDKDGEPALSSPSWYTYTGSEGSPPHTIIPNPGVVLAIRTADNKYVKLQIQSYYMGGARIPRDGEASRYYTFRYQFQPNGSKEF